MPLCFRLVSVKIKTFQSFKSISHDVPFAFVFRYDDERLTDLFDIDLFALSTLHSFGNLIA